MQALIHADLVVRSIQSTADFLRRFLDFSIYDESIVSGSLPKFLSAGRCSSMRLVMLRLAPMGAMLELMEFLDATADFPEQTNTNRVSISILVSDLDQVIARTRDHGVVPETTIFSVRIAKAGNQRIFFFEILTDS